MQRNTFIMLIGCFLLFSFLSSNVFAEREDHREKYDSKHLPPVSNETYKQECGACHFTYQPDLLPSGSWEKILAALPSHFGEEVSLNQESKRIIGEYLHGNAAENSSAKRAKKILNSIKGELPLRITETPYIREKHHELNTDVFNRASIGSFSNCVACHTKAEQGNFDDDYVKVPR